jgi:hypothetical protein
MRTPSYTTAAYLAHYAVSRAVRLGILSNLRKRRVGCIDCGKRAKVYDHRDYNRPLDVVPVCAGCNLRRGPAQFVKPPDFSIRYYGEFLSVRIPEKFMEKLRSAARKKNMTLSAFVKKLLTDGVAQSE